MPATALLSEQAEPGHPEPGWGLASPSILGRWLGRRKTVCLAGCVKGMARDAPVAGLTGPCVDARALPRMQPIVSLAADN